MSENSLIKQAQQGEAAAFEELLQRHYDRLFSFAYRWCGNQSNAEDITQLACIKLSRSIKQFRFDSSFSTWLYKIVINCAKDFYKSQKRHSDREDNLDSYEYQLHSNDRHQQRLFAQQIMQHIDSMQDGLKEAILLVYAEGLTHSEAAKILEVKESTVSWRLHEVRKILKQQFSSTSLGSETSTGGLI
ncbi:MAG: RNA polymerase sigma factor [Arenicella sp.]